MDRLLWERMTTQLWKRLTRKLEKQEKKYKNTSKLVESRNYAYMRNTYQDK
jgi:hypothetical protein